MTLTLLLDMDDTLLSNPMESFMPAYISLLSKALSSHISSDKMVPRLLYATDEMVKKEKPSKTLEETFDEFFYPALGLEKTDLAPTLEDFYHFPFQELKKVTSPKPDAISLVNHALENQYRIVIATNPLFPQEAMISRLKWAGLDPAAFDFITSYENMHFAKPNPAYYAEILGTLGWPVEPVFMVGNSLKDDILPASQLGINCFWLDGNEPASPDLDKYTFTFGPLRSVIEWIEEKSISVDPNQFDFHPAILSVIKSTPAVLENLLAKIEPKICDVQPETNEWSIKQILLHLVNVESSLNLFITKQILTLDDPVMEGSPDSNDDYMNDRIHLSISDLLDEFFSSREKLIAILDTVNGEDWQRQGTHPFFGCIQLQRFVSLIARHDQDHIRQIFRNLSTQRDFSESGNV